MISERIDELKSVYDILNKRERTGEEPNDLELSIARLLLSKVIYDMEQEKGGQDNDCNEEQGL